MTTFWLCADEKYLRDPIDFSSPDDMVIPVVMLQTGNSRSPLYPGIYRAPRIRTYSDKFGTPTTITSTKEITFSAIIYGKSMDDIYGKFQRINSYLDRAEISAGVYTRGTGVVFIEQMNDAREPTVWDVVSGVLTDVDFNLPDQDIVAAVVQLSVLPFSRGRPYFSAIEPFVRANGFQSILNVPYVGRGDAPGLFELQLLDQSPPGHEITWVAIGRRSYPLMQINDFQAYYSTGTASTITGNEWQTVLQQFGALGTHNTGLFDVYAVVHDASPVIDDISGIATQTQQGFGSLPNGYVTFALVPKNFAGVAGSTSTRIVQNISNPHQPGNVQDSEGFEDFTWSRFATQPIGIVPGSGSANLTIDRVSAIKGFFGAHFKVTGDTTASSITEAKVNRFMPGIVASGSQSIAYKINPVSWGSYSGSLTSPVADPVSGPTVSTGSGLGSPVTPPTLSFNPTYPAFTTQKVWEAGYTWITPSGESTLSATSTILSTAYPNIFIPAFPAGVTAARVYFGVHGVMPVCMALAQVNTPEVPFDSNGLVPASGTYILYCQFPTPAQEVLPPSTDTTGSKDFPVGTYYFSYTWVTAQGETKASPATAHTFSQAAGATVTIPAFPSGVTAAKIYVSNVNTTTPLFVILTNTPGTVGVVQGSGAPSPATNTTGSPASAVDSQPRFTWGSLTIIPTGSQNNFVAKVASTQITGAFYLAPGVVHDIGCNFQQTGIQGLYSIIVDGVFRGSLTGVIGTDIDIPVLAEWAAVGFGHTPAFTEEYYLDEIYVYDQLLLPGFDTSGSSASIEWTNGANHVQTDVYFAVTVTGDSSAPEWYFLPDVASPFSFGTRIPFGATKIVGPPAIAPQIGYAQLRIGIGTGSGPERWIYKPPVRTKLANAMDEFIRLGTCELPPSAKTEYADQDPWSVIVQVKSGAGNASFILVESLILFPADEDGWTGLTAKAFGTRNEHAYWRIGTNRFGRSYARLYSPDGNVLVDSADVTGAIGTFPGDNDFIVFTGRDDGKGNLIMDLTQTFSLGWKETPRNHFQVTELPAR